MRMFGFIGLMISLLVVAYLSTRKPKMTARTQVEKEALLDAGITSEQDAKAIEAAAKAQLDSINKDLERKRAEVMDQQD